MLLLLVAGNRLPLSLTSKTIKLQFQIFTRMDCLTFLIVTNVESLNHLKQEGLERELGTATFLGV